MNWIHERVHELLSRPEIALGLPRRCLWRPLHCCCQCWACFSGSRIAETWPEDAQHWIWVAYATRRCRSVEEAEVWLKRAREAHPTEPTIPYNLSCYAAVTGRIEEAKQLLERAIRLDANVRMMALEDPDLEPLWESFAVNTEP